jgi:hypothetical protein
VSERRQVVIDWTGLARGVASEEAAMVSRLNPLSLGLQAAISAANPGWDYPRVLASTERRLAELASGQRATHPKTRAMARAALGIPSPPPVVLSIVRPSVTAGDRAAGPGVVASVSGVGVRAARCECTGCRAERGPGPAVVPSVSTPRRSR